MTPTPDPLVRAALRAGPTPAGPHPDAEVLALYAERALESDEVPAVERHVAACLRCQTIVAEIAITAPEVASHGAVGAPGWLGWFSGWRWLMPAASLAAVAAVAVWLGQPSPDRAAGFGPASVDSQASPAPTPAPAVALADAPAPAASTRPQAPSTAPPAERSVPMAATFRATDAPPGAQPSRAAESTANLAKTASAEATGSRPPVTAFADAAGPAGASLGAAAAAEARAERGAAAAAPTPAPAAAPAQARSAAPLARDPRQAERTRDVPAFRVTAGRLERSTDEGQTWQLAATPPSLHVLAVAPVSTRVAWAVSRDAVLRTLDGDTWARVAAPPGTPYRAVEASGADRATVTTADGVRYATTDGGQSWRREP